MAVEGGMESALDIAFGAMQTGEEQRFYQVLAQTPLFLVLDTEPVDETLTPRLFDLQSGRMVLAFDSLDRLGSWAAEMGAGTLPYAMLPGRIIAQQLAAQDLALGLNFGAPSQIILPPEAMVWLTEVLDVTPRPIQARIERVLPLGALPPGLIAALDLRAATGLARAAHLAKVAYTGGGQGHILAFTDAAAEAPLTRAIAEALVFSGVEAGMLDVTFIQGGSPLARQLAQLGLALDIPAPPEADAPPPRAAPGSDPAKPPILK